MLINGDSKLKAEYKSALAIPEKQRYLINKVWDRMQAEETVAENYDNKNIYFA